MQTTRGTDTTGGGGSAAGASGSGSGSSGGERRIGVQQHLQQLLNPQQQQQQAQSSARQYQSPLLQLIQMTGLANLQDLISNTFETGDLSDILSNSVLNINSAYQSPYTPVQSKGILGEAIFFEAHNRPVKAVDFSPQDDHIFSSAAVDGKINVYDARFSKLLASKPISHLGTSTFTGLKHMDGRRIVLTCGSNKILIYDIEKGSTLQTIDQRVSSTTLQSTRVPVAVDPNNCNIFVVPNSSGKGITHIDLRQPNVIKTIEDIHEGLIHDLEILEPSWARAFAPSSSHDPIILTASADTTVKITDSQKHVFKKFEMKSQVYSIAHTPDVDVPLRSGGSDEQVASISSIAIGGDKINIFPATTGSDAFLSQQLPSVKTINRLKYTHGGDRLFVAGNDGSLRLYNRTKKKYENMGIVYKHGKDIQDMCISKNDEYIVTASSDQRIGLIRIGEPLYGPSEYGDII